LSPSVTRTVQITLPVGCAVNAPIHVTVRVRDGSGTEVSREAGSITIVDTAPVISVEVENPPYFVGDTLDVTFTATADDGLKALYWEILPSGTRDSVLVSGTSVTRLVRIPLRAEWAGPFQVRLYARDVGDDMSNVIVANNAPLYPTVHRQTKSFVRNTHTWGMTIDQKRNTFYIYLQDLGIEVVSMETMDIVGVLPTSGFMGDLTPSGDSLIVMRLGTPSHGISNYDMVTVDLQTVATVTRVFSYTFGVAEGHISFRVAGNGLAMFGGGIRTYQMNLNTGVRTERGDPGWFGRSHDYSTLALNGIPSFGSRLKLYDTSTNQFFGSVVTSLSRRPALDADGDRVVMGYTVYDRSLQVVRVLTPPWSENVALTHLSPDGEIMYVFHPRHGMIRMRVSDGSMIDRTRLPIIPTEVEMSADGGTLLLQSVRFNQGSGYTSTFVTVDLR
jgi:hypothetical protein